MSDTTKRKSVNITVLTVSDTRTDQNDKSGDTLVTRLTEAGHHLVEKRIVKDELSLLKNVLKEWINSSEVDVIIATGGTGVTGRDVTPEAFESLYEKPIPGFGELFRWL
ncbi:MAG TPA: molybdenum cofactor biosynthesis protein, partial [Nitrospina sp.]|nr:molybdenum cofactor biosynthesis protein [Nitrospina sp.]